MIIKRVGVIGGGTMGRGIAEMLAKKGLEVYLKEKSPELRQEALRLIRASLDKQLEKWSITEAEIKLIQARIHGVDRLEEVAGCDLVIESVAEDLELKKEVFRELDRICAEHVLLASNTAALSLTELAGETMQPERIIGMHFLHPVSQIGLVEIVRGLKTSEETFRQALDFVERVIEKKGVMVYESPGFVTTRLIDVLINEALHTLNEGVASAEDIDTAMRVGYNFHYGPLEMADRMGLDSVLASMERLFREYGDLKYRPSIVLKKMVRAGHLGLKTGEGFFRYNQEGDRI